MKTLRSWKFFNYYERTAANQCKRFYNVSSNFPSLWTVIIRVYTWLEDGASHGKTSAVYHQQFTDVTPCACFKKDVQIQQLLMSYSDHALYFWLEIVLPYEQERGEKKKSSFKTEKVARVLNWIDPEKSLSHVEHTYVCVKLNQTIQEAGSLYCLLFYTCFIPCFLFLFCNKKPYTIQHLCKSTNVLHVAWSKKYQIFTSVHLPVLDRSDYLSRSPKLCETWNCTTFRYIQSEKSCLLNCQASHFVMPLTKLSCSADEMSHGCPMSMIFVVAFVVVRWSTASIITRRMMIIVVIGNANLRIFSSENLTMHAVFTKNSSYSDTIRISIRGITMWRQNGHAI